MTMHGAWPALPFAEWRETCETLHMWTQIVGKIRLAQAPPQNHWWHVALYVTPRGLTTSAMPHGTRLFSISFDLVDHALVIVTSDGDRRTVPLMARSTADFYEEVTAKLRELALPVQVWPHPVEVETSIPFDRDTVHVSYDREAVERFRGALQQADRVLQRFRESLALLEAQGAEIVEVSAPSFDYAIAAYYLILPAEASSNLAKFDSVRFGLRVDVPGGTVEDVMAASREAGFGDEVKRRIILGTYALSAGYYDAY